MNLSYELTLVDYINFDEYHFKTRTNFFQKNLRLILFIFFLVYVVFSFKKPIQEEILDWSYWVLIAFVGGLFYFINRRIFKSRKSAVESLVKGNPTLVGKRELSLSDEKVIIIGEGTKLEYDYNFIRSVEEDNNLVYVYLSEQNAILIPKRSIANDQIVNILREKMV